MKEFIGKAKINFLSKKRKVDIKNWLINNNPTEKETVCLFDSVHRNLHYKADQFMIKKINIMEVPDNHLLKAVSGYYLKMYNLKEKPSIKICKNLCGKIFDYPGTACPCRVYSVLSISNSIVLALEEDVKHLKQEMPEVFEQQYFEIWPPGCKEEKKEKSMVDIFLNQLEQFADKAERIIEDFENKNKKN